jgi:hypothetical protein
MNMRTRVVWAVIATLLWTCLGAVTVNPTALAQNRGNSGLPSGPGNPMARLQLEINALTQQIAALARLGQEVSTLQQQVAALQQQVLALPGLQRQINTLSTQIASLNTQMVGFSSQLAALGTSDPLGVFDANGKKMGDVVGVQDSIPWVSLTATGHVFVLQVSPGQLIGGFLWYTGPNCSGSVYISDYAAFIDGPNVFSVAAVHEPGGVVYAAAADAPLQRVGVRSVLLHDGTCYDYGSSFSQYVAAATPVMTLDANFKRPYSVH